MRNDDLYIREALKILDENNSYFKKVYASESKPMYYFAFELKGKKYLLNTTFSSPELASQYLSELSNINQLDDVELFTEDQISSLPDFENQVGDGKIFETEVDMDSAIIDLINSSDSPSFSSSTKTTEEKVDEPSVDNKQVYSVYKFICRDNFPDTATREFVTVPTLMHIDSFRMILEFFGWQVLDQKTLGQNENAQKLRTLVPNNAITQNFNVKAPGSKMLSYNVRLSWGPEEDRKTKSFHTVATLLDKEKVENLFQVYLVDQLSDEQKESYQDVSVTVTPSNDLTKFGTFQFTNINPNLLASQERGLASSQAYQITCKDDMNNEHQFRTVKSQVPIDDYMYRLQLAGFHDIVFNPVSLGGSVKLSDIDSNFKSMKRQPSNPFNFKGLFRKKADPEA
jgi:hypothetical protein